MKQIFLFFLLLLISIPFLIGNTEKKITLETEAVIPVAIFSPETESWTLLSKLNEGDELLEKIELSVGDKDIVYYEDRITRNGEKISIAKKMFKEPEKEIALKLLDTSTGEIKVIKIQQRGAELISPFGYKIEIVERLNGIRWNKWNTNYKVVEPVNYIVLKNKYPAEVEYTTVKKTVTDKTGKKKNISQKQKIVKGFVYAPYSEDLHTPEIIEAGRQHIKLIVQNAFDELSKKGIKSKIFPDKLVSEIEALPPRFFERLTVLEQSDLGEFTLNPQKTTERVLVLIGSNGQNAFSKTGSKAGALGWIQFTSSTYKIISKSYPAAKLIKDFEKGAADHLNSMMAAILLHNSNLSELVKSHGEKVLKDPRLEEYLASAYNGGASRVNSSLRASASYGLKDWASCLLPKKIQKKSCLFQETKGFVFKLRTLQANDWP